MSGKKKKKNHRIQQPLVRLSQCMIVKNEEKNIERALEWARDIAYEQIVVDTGSTDRTVEIAEKLGAKVFHFKWIDDFAAAKNFAIEQASGNWIAFLDADEYFSKEDAKKLMILLRQVQSNPELRLKYRVFVCPWVQLDDAGRPFAVLEQNRIFQNRPDIRYTGTIHEALTITEEVPFTPEISIMHTGYTREAYEDTKKAERNVKLIRLELEKNPDNANLMVYLADSLSIEPASEENRAEAEFLYRKALEDRHNMHPQLVKNAYLDLIPKYTGMPDKLDEAEKYAKQAYEDFPDDLDFMYYYGTVLSRRKRSYEALKIFGECENELMNATEMTVSVAVLPKPLRLFYEIALASQDIGDIENTVKYVTLTLREDKYQDDVLPQYMNILKSNGVDDDSIVNLLSKMYNFNSIKDKLFASRCAKIAGDMFLFEKLYKLITPEEHKWIAGSPIRETLKKLDAI